MRRFILMKFPSVLWLGIAIGAFSQIGLAQPFYPEDAHVDLYFPQLADGGSAAQQWQTSFAFVNPSTSSTAQVALRFLGNDGGPLAIDFGQGAKSQLQFTIPPLGSRVLRSTIASPIIVTGWALGASSIPLQATVLFRSITNGVSSAEVSALATLPSLQYLSPGNKQLGIAIANPSPNLTTTLNLQPRNADGTVAGNASANLSPLAHTSFVASQVFSGLPDSFSGTVTITGSDPFVAWTLNAEFNVPSSLPPGRLDWPISHQDRIRLVYNRVLDAALRFLTPLNVSLTAPAPVLVVSAEPVINAFANQNGTVQINLALSELISDSPSELAFAMAHELGHIVQFNVGAPILIPTNTEQDADMWGLIFSLVAGFDPYASAGTLAKLNMALGQAGLLDQLFDNFSGDLHGSFNQRIALVFSEMQSICSQQQVASACAAYKSLIHPHLPPIAPLLKPELEEGLLKRAPVLSPAKPE